MYLGEKEYICVKERVYMLKTNVGSSTNADAFLSGTEAAQKARVGLDNPKLALLYSSVDYADQKEVVKGVNAIFPGVPVIGCTSFTGIITNEGYISGEKGFSGVMAFDDTDLTVGVASSKKQNDARETGRIVAKKAMENAGRDDEPEYFYMVCAPGEEEYYLKGIEDVIGRVPFFGGSAADNTIEGKWQMFTSEEVFAEGVGVAFFYTDKKMANVFSGVYKETNNVGIITKVKDNRQLMEIDGVPALKKYAEWTNQNPDDLMGGNLLSATITAPLGVKDRLGDLVAIRHPMGGNSDYSMNVGNKLAEHTAVIQMEASIDELIDSVRPTLVETQEKLQKPAGYLLVHCGGRRAGIGERITEVYDRLKAIAGDVPFMTIFTFGEYGHVEDGMNTCGGLMLSFTGFEQE